MSTSDGRRNKVLSRFIPNLGEVWKALGRSAFKRSALTHSGSLTPLRSRTTLRFLAMATGQVSLTGPTQCRVNRVSLTNAIELRDELQSCARESGTLGLSVWSVDGKLHMESHG